MKKTFFAILLAAATLVGCKDNKQPDPETLNETKIHLDYDAKTWYYYSFATKSFVGSGLSADDAKWFARTDWDFAICEYELRTNSGTSTTASAKGGAHRSDKTKLADITSIPSTYTVDTEFSSTGMGGVVTVKSQTIFDPNYKYYGVVDYMKNPTDPTSPDMSGPGPTYLQAPVYVFKTANGESFYKVLFTKYTTDVTGANPEPGIVEFSYLKME